MQEWEGGEVTIGGRDQAKLSINASCGGLVGVVEHVHVSVDISSNTRSVHMYTCTLVHKTGYYSNTRRCLFSIELQSPSGTVSQLLAPRPLENSSLSGEYLYREVKDS